MHINLFSVAFMPTEGVAWAQMTGRPR